MDWKAISIEALLAGFFAVACLKGSEPVAETGALHFGDMFRLSGRIERIRRSRWAWFSLVAFMLVLRLQQQLPLITELIALIEFAVFVMLPTHTPERGR
ncbi:MAG: hypothetical protein ACRD40_12935 [Candidatus Acidiferrales bacterium]